MWVMFSKWGLPRWFPDMISFNLNYVLIKLCMFCRYEGRNSHSFWIKWNIFSWLFLMILSTQIPKFYFFRGDDCVLCSLSNERAINLVISGLNSSFIGSWIHFLIYQCIACDWVLADEAVPHKIEQSFIV